jgi:hypothetical protein
MEASAPRILGLLTMNRESLGIKNGSCPHSDYLDPNRPADIVPVNYGPDFLR